MLWGWRDLQRLELFLRIYLASFRRDTTLFLPVFAIVV